VFLDWLQPVSRNGPTDVQRGTAAVDHAEMANRRRRAIALLPDLSHAPRAGYEVEGVYSSRAALSFLRPNRPYDLFVFAPSEGKPGE
jgi:hypothetical protein